STPRHRHPTVKNHLSCDSAASSSRSSLPSLPPPSVSLPETALGPCINPEVPLINELEDMLLVDRKRPRYEDDLMDDTPPKRLRTANLSKMPSPPPDGETGMISFECDDLLDEVSDDKLLPG
ncbi:hypothetical protein LINGRAHAP2_LOCUS31067, partial [Linum grandiflorum]